MNVDVTSKADRLRAGLRWPAVQLSGLFVLAGIVVVRLALMTYWSWDDLTSTGSRQRLLLAWTLGGLVLLVLARFAWHVLKGTRSVPTSRE
jgi:hypothetical protein